ncbi:MAG: hypothetical protein AAGG44_04805 [Planctomycetota bacterium]
MRTALCLLSFALIVRVGVLVADRSDYRLLNGLAVSQLSLAVEDNNLDPDSYGRLALNLARSGVYGFGDEANGNLDTSVKATAFRPPLYPWLLSWFVSGGKLNGPANAILHIGLGAIAVLLTWRVGGLLSLGKFSVLSAAAVALDPLLLRASQLRMTETLATTFMLVVWWGLLEWRERLALASNGSKDVNPRRFSVGMFAIGLLAGLSVLARPTFAPWCFLVCVTIWFWRASREGATRLELPRIWPSLCFAIGLLLVVVPWTARNYVAFGRPIWATTHGGYTLLLANNPSLYEHFANNGPGRDWDAESFHVAWSHRGDRGAEPWEEAYWFADFPSTSSPQLEEVEDNALAYEAAWATISREPTQCLRASVYRLGWFWAMWPLDSDGFERWAITLWYAVFYALGVFGAGQLLFEVRSRHETGFMSWLPGLLFIITLTGIHAVFWSNMRMRAPLMPVVYLLSMIPLSKYSRFFKAIGLSGAS